MFSKVFFNDIGGNLSPIPFKRSVLDFITQPSAVLGSGIIGSVTSAIGQSSANKSNERIARENRDWQTKQNQLNRDWELEMWNKNNEYNTPSAQRKRLQEAGYNPWISGSGGMSNVSQMPFTPAIASAPNAPHMENVFGNASSIFQNGVSGAVQSAQIGANVANQNAKTAIDAIKAYDEFLKASFGDYKGGKRLLGVLLKPLGYTSQQMNEIMNATNLNYLYHHIQTDLADVEYRIKANLGESKARAEIDNLNKLTQKLDSDIIHNKSLNDLNDAQIKELAERTAKELQEKLTIEESRKFILRKLEAEAKILEADPMADGTFASISKASPILSKFIGLLIKLLK